MCLLMDEGMACGGQPFRGTGCSIPDVENLCFLCIEFYDWDVVSIFNHLLGMISSTNFVFLITDWTCCADGAVASLTLHSQCQHYNGVGTVPITTVTVPKGALEMPDLSESSDKSVHTAYAVNDTVVKYDRQQLFQIGLNNTTHLNRTVRKTLFRHSIWRPNRRITSVNSTMDCAPNCFEEGTNHQIQSSLNDERPSRTLISITRQSMSVLGRRKFASTCLISSRSLRNKAAIIKDHIATNNFDLVAVTETWLGKNDNDKAVEKDITPAGFKFVHLPRPAGRGGGIGIIHKKQLDVRLQDITIFQSFEHMQLLIKSFEKWIRVLVVYCPTPSATNKLTVSLFLSEFTTLLANLSITSGELFILGDFNLHVDKPSDPDASQFFSLLYAFGLTQYVRESTQTHGHTLDLVITRCNETTLFDTSVTDLEISDHYAIVLKISLEKPAFPKKKIVHRQWKKFNITDFKNDFASSNFAESDMHTVVQQFNRGLMNLIDKHAPLRERVVTVRPKAPWYNSEIDTAKRLRRNWSTNGSKRNYKLTMIILESNVPW